MQPHQKRHRPNDQGEVRMTTITHASKLKGCAHTNEDEEDSNGKLQKGPKSKPKPKLKVEEKGQGQNQRDSICQASN